MQSAKNICAYIYSDAGDGESSTDLVFAGHNIIAENGTMVAQSKRFESSNITYGDIAVSYTHLQLKLKNNF